MKKWLDQYQYAGQVPISDNASYRKPLVISEEEMFRNRLPQPKYYSFNEDRYANTPGRRALSEADRKAYALKKNVKSAVKGADILTDIMQVGNFIPIPQVQVVGKWGNVLGAGVDAFQAGMDVSEGNYGNAAINFGFALLPSVIENQGYRRDMWNTTPGSYADKIANFGSRSGNYIHLTPYVNQATNPVIMRGVNFNRGLLGTLGAETIIDSRKNGGLVSQNSLNRTVTCSNCGWSWKLSDGGMDPMTCHKCGGTIKMEYGGGPIITNRGQWDYPGQTTIIPSNQITMQGVPYPVMGVDNTGYTKMMQPGMDYTFPGQYVTEYPMMQGGGQMSINDIKNAYKIAANNYNNRVFPEETLETRKKAYDTIEPSDYTDIDNYTRWNTGEKRISFSDPRSEEAWKFYLGLNKPEDLRYLRKSQYAPTINATQKNYYSVDPNLEQDIFNSYKDKVKLNETLQTDESEIETPLSGDDGAAALGRFGVSRGHDDKGDYVSYYDKYDLKNFAQKRTKGTPYSIYGRIYYPKKAEGGEMIDYKSGGQHGGLDRWFAEKWVDIKTGEPCGRQQGENRNYPACRPSKRISSETPKTASELSSSEKERFKREKTSSKRISYQHDRKEYGGETLNLETMKSGGNVPTNPSLWSRAKAAAKSKYDVYPSAYANGFAAKWYKSHGGGWRKAEYGMEIPIMAEGGKPEWLIEAQLKAQGYSGNALEQKLISMANGGQPQNAGFQALPNYVQEKIMSNMARGGSVIVNAGGEKHRIYVKPTNRGEGAKGHIMVNHPTMDKGEWDTIDLTKKAGATTIAQGVAATKKWHRENPYKKQEGGDVYWRTGQPMINDPSMDAISKVLLYRNQDKNFMQRAAGLGYQGGIPTRYIDGQDPNSNNTSTLLMSFGDNQVFPTIIQTGPQQLSYQPDQYQEYIETPSWDVADYFSTKGYKRAANDMYGMEYKNGGYVVRRSHDRKGKTHVVIGPDGTKKYFGDPNMGERSKSKYGKEAFYARHKHNLEHNPYFRAYARATWEEGGQIMAIGGQSTLNPVVKKDNRNWLEYLKN